MQNRESSAVGTPMPFSNGDSYRFRLKKCNSRTKLTCPSCGQKHRFVPYYDTEGKITFPDYVGRCDREDNCRYHYTPGTYFQEHPDAKKGLFEEGHNIPPVNHVVEQKPKPPPSFISRDLMQQTMKAYDHNNLVLFLRTIMNVESADRAVKRYNVGTAKKWENSTVFWQIDMDGNVHAGKIILYNSTDGHRVKNENRKDVAWVHSTLRMQDFVLEQCYFGEHLLVDRSKAVALVESEKTAIIASEFFQNYIWIASGGKSGCFNSRMHILKGRNVVLYPDLKATNEWQVKAEQMRRIGISVEVSTYLEDVATEEERAAGLDIADYIIKGIREHQFIESAPRREKEELLKRFIDKYPALQILIDKLQLELIY